jgi:non-ribosomal peptide synthetase component F
MLVAALNTSEGQSLRLPYRVKFRLEEPPRAFELPGLDVSFIKPERGEFKVKLDLTLAMREGPEGLCGSWEYNASLFERVTVIRLTEAYATLLRACADDPGRPLSALFHPARWSTPER